MRVSFGAVQAVDGVSVELAGDEVLGLVGPNGSGKTTFLNALCGVVPATGRLEVDGQGVRLARPASVARAGLARVFQAPQTFEGLSCLENVLVSSSDRRARGLLGATLGRPVMWRHERRRWEAAHEALELVGLSATASLPVGQLTYGQRRLVEVARGIAASPKVLLLDEPSAGLNDAETDELADLLARVHARGVALLVIEHKIDFLDRLCDRVVVLELGSVIAEGPPADVWRDERVMSAYLGASRAAG